MSPEANEPAKRHAPMRPNYIILDVRGSLFGDMPSLRGMTSNEANAIIDRIVREHGAHREATL